MNKIAVWPSTANPLAPYTPGVRAGATLYVSGQVPLDPATKALVEGEFEDRVRQCMANVRSVLQAGGTDLDAVVKVTIFLTDMGMFSRLNAVYGEYWSGTKPARSCVQVAALPMGVDVEIEAIAQVD